MKKTILSFFAGVGFVILTAAATGITEVKPATPKNTVVLSSTYPREIGSKMIPYINSGYVTKSLATSNYGIVVIMEKY